MARALLDRLSKVQIGYTVATFLRKHYPSPTLEPLDRSLGIVPFGRIALKLASALIAMGSFAHDVALLAAAKRATIDGSSSRLAIDIGDLIGAVNQVGLADVDTTDAVLALETLIAGSIAFVAPSVEEPTRLLDWRDFALRTSTAKLARRSTGARTKMGVLNSLLGELGEFNMASASMCDVLATASGSTTAAHRVYQVSGSAAEEDLNPTSAVFDEICYYASNGEPGVKCGSSTCDKDNRAKSLVCSGCKQFMGPVWWCSVCNLPSLDSEPKCRQWMCVGTKTARKPPPNDKAEQHASSNTKCD